jgi:hypothetical protein
MTTASVIGAAPVFCIYKLENLVSPDLPLESAYFFETLAQLIQFIQIGHYIFLIHRA